MGNCPGDVGQWNYYASTEGMEELLTDRGYKIISSPKKKKNEVDFMIMDD